MNSLQGLTENREEVRELIRAVRMKLPSVKQMLETIGTDNDKSIIDILTAYSMIGVSSMVGKDREVKELLGYFHRLISGIKTPMSPEAIGMCLKSLKGIKTSENEIRALLEVLESQIRAVPSNDVFSTIDIGNCMLGLYCSSSDSPQVLDILQTLTRRIRASTDSFNSESRGSVLLGMRCLSSEHIEVRMLLSALTEKIRTSENGEFK